MASKIYLNDLPKIVKENHEHNDKYYSAAPLHPALLIQDPKLSQNDIETLLKLLHDITKENQIRLYVPAKYKNSFINRKNVLLKNPLPTWAQIISIIPFLANAAYGALDFKNLGNFVVSIGTGPNLFVIPHITTFHIAIINQKLNTKKLAQFALVRPEIIVVLNNPTLTEQIKKIRKHSLGKPTFSISQLTDLTPILKKALGIYNKMPFRWVEDLKDFSQEETSKN